ncbi:hypothetical protein WME79_04065 [Sorangium sp. So ce726]|uniref:hypothetical protein n=1 Tax=Sorangium sp. So ce726 TaxID=3133319 RepID=UPI003F5FCDEC
MDDSESPLLVFTLPERLDEHLFIRLHEELCAFCEALRGPYALVIDARKARGISAKQRQLVADTDRRLLAIDRMYNAGQAYVLSSALARGALTAIRWLSPPAFPQAVFEHPGPAIVWARRSLAQRLGQGAQVASSR